MCDKTWKSQILNESRALTYTFGAMGDTTIWDGLAEGSADVRTRVNLNPPTKGGGA